MYIYIQATVRRVARYRDSFNGVRTAVDGRVIVKAVVADRAVRARRVGVDTAAVLELTACCRLHWVAYLIVLDLYSAHVRALSPTPTRADRRVGLVTYCVVHQRRVRDVPCEYRVRARVLARQVIDQVVRHEVATILQ